MMPTSAVGCGLTRLNVSVDEAAPALLDAPRPPDDGGYDPREHEQGDHHVAERSEVDIADEAPDFALEREPVDQDLEHLDHAESERGGHPQARDGEVLVKPPHRGWRTPSRRPS